MSGKYIDYEEGGTKLRGFLALPARKAAKVPGVLVVHDGAGFGPFAQERAELLANMGYAAFALDMYGGKPPIEDVLKVVNEFRAEPRRIRDRALAGLEILRSAPNVDKDRIGAIGYCFGGTTVLELARDLAPIKGVASFHGQLDTVSPGKKFDAKILVLTGSEDHKWVPLEQRVALEEEMRAAQADWQMMIYGGASHTFTDPSADSHGRPDLGYHKVSADRAWAEMKRFFWEVFGE
jgi:dienelactone hydrolase